MYRELHIEYADPSNNVNPICLKYKLTPYDITQRWANKVAYCLNNLAIDDPYRFYGFDDLETERQKSINSINSCIDTINEYRPNFITKKVSYPIIQDTLNYLHHIFEVFHGTVNKPHEFFIAAPKQVQDALSQLNLLVHRCEGFVETTGRKTLPAHMITWFNLPKQETLELSDYQYFTDYIEFGTVYLMYTEIGKTLQDLAFDNDQYIDVNAYKPFRFYSSDFMVRFYGISVTTWRDLRKKYRQHYLENQEFYDSTGYDFNHPYNTPGNIPVANLIQQPIDVVKELKIRQMVKQVNLL